MTRLHGHKADKPKKERSEASMAIAKNRAPIPKKIRLLGKDRQVKLDKVWHRGQITLPAYTTPHGDAKLVIWIETDAYFPNTYRYSIFVKDPQIQRVRPKTVLWLAHSHTAFNLEELERYLEVSCRRFEKPLTRYKSMPFALEIEYERYLTKVMRDTLSEQGHTIQSKVPTKARIGKTTRFSVLEAGCVPTELDVIARPDDPIGTVRTYST